MTSRKYRILFLFSGATNRKKIFDDVRHGKNADTALRGLNHIPGAEFIDVEETARSMVPSWFYRLLPWQMRGLVLCSRVLPYDVVIAQDDLPLGYLVSTIARVLRKDIRWFYIAINSSMLIRRHAAHPVRRFLLKTFWKSYTRIICLSQAQLEDFVHIGIPREHLVFIPFGVDARFFAIDEHVKEEEIVVSVGRDLGRDYLTLFAAIAPTPYKLVVVAAHKNIPPGTPVPENVSVLYDRNPNELRTLYARARLVVIASKEMDVLEGSDCSGQTVILDALAAGKAVIATDRPWIADYFTPGKELIVVKPHDPVVLADAIEKLWHNEQERERLSHAGYLKVQERYTTKVFAQALQKLIASTL